MKPLMRKVLMELWSFAKELARIVLRSSWQIAKSLARWFVIVAGMFYLWACFGTGQPHRFLSGHETWVVFDQCMRSIQEKGCPL